MIPLQKLHCAIYCLDRISGILFPSYKDYIMPFNSLILLLSYDVQCTYMHSSLEIQFLHTLLSKSALISAIIIKYCSQDMYLCDLNSQHNLNFILYML